MTVIGPFWESGCQSPRATKGYRVELIHSTQGAFRGFAGTLGK